jgi:hypothetical protein
MYSYLDARTKVNSLKAFMVKASEMRYGKWNPDLTAGPIVNYLQAGFTRE